MHFINEIMDLSSFLFEMSLEIAYLVDFVLNLRCWSLDKKGLLTQILLLVSRLMIHPCSVWTNCFGKQNAFEFPNVVV